MFKERVTERTFYPALIEVIHRAGGTGVQEVCYNSSPDIVFRLEGERWLLSVKIGQDLRMTKSAFLQYLRHKEESGIPRGMLLLLPQAARSVPATETAVAAAVHDFIPAVLIDAGPIKEEIRDRSFPRIIEFLRNVVLPRLARHERSFYRLPLVIGLLKQQVADVMKDIALEESSILQIVTDRKLIMDLGHLSQQQVEDVARFLASYILMSQVLFLRLLTSSRPNLVPWARPPITHHKLRRAFSRVLEINYRPIYAIDVLDSIRVDFLRDTFDLIWGLEVENVRYELPGRIFHELMPTEIRKMLAAFYTRPQAADMLAHLAIRRSDETVFDPACGSGTILVSAYRRKRQLFRQELRPGDPHKRFAEEEIFGADIMPFAVHLTSANLAAVAPETTIDRTQIIQANSLELVSGKIYRSGIGQLGLALFPTAPQSPYAETTDGVQYAVPLGRVDTILMNPPFTKIERGIRAFVNMERFRDRVGGEVGLWGHFVAFADIFLKDQGMYGAVLPINVLRGRESERVRRILFDEWTPLYILKPTLNYGFSESAEYRDVLFLARKQKPRPSHQVKFCLIKRDLTGLEGQDTFHIAERIEAKHILRSDDLDIDTHSLSEIQDRFVNMMWFCGTADFRHRDILIRFLDRVLPNLGPIDRKLMRTGYRLEGGYSKFLFLTRHSDDCRVRRAFLRFREESASSLVVQSPLGAEYLVEKSALRPSLRTPVGLATMDVTGNWDYVACHSYGECARVCRAAGIAPDKIQDQGFWTGLHSQIEATETHLSVSRRVNPFSPATCHLAFYASEPICPSDQLNVVQINRSWAGPLCTVLNSVISLCQVFLLMEESTGRYVDIRLYDLAEMSLVPDQSALASLSQVLKEFGQVPFPPLCKQLDQDFYARYAQFWEQQRGSTVQQPIWSLLDQPVEPWPQRVDFDLEVCRALGVSVSREDLIEVYTVLVKEMMLTRGLRRD